MKLSTRILAIFVLLLGFIVFSLKTQAQSVQLQGKVFVHQSAKDSVDTGYLYRDSEGNNYPIFLSSKGKAYAWIKSKKTGKMYKRYLPKITEILKRKKL